MVMPMPKAMLLVAIFAAATPALAQERTQEQTAPPRWHGLRPGTGIDTIMLPPSRIEPIAPPAAESESGEAKPGAPADPLPDPAVAAADAAWEAMLERRRADVDVLEKPITESLNRDAAVRQGRIARAQEEAEADHRRRLAEYEAALRRQEAEHRAALEAHARAVERQRAEHQRAVAACLAGDYSFCAAPPR